MSLTDQILSSGFYRKAENRAKAIAGNTGKVTKLLGAAMNKFNTINFIRRIKFSNIKEDLGLFFRLLIAYYKGEYKAIPWKTLIKMLSAIVYFVFIIDLIPDFIPVAGYLDDITLFAWVINSIRSDLEKFKQWEEGQKAVT